MKKILLGTIALLLVGTMVFAGGKKDAAKEEVVDSITDFSTQKVNGPLPRQCGTFMTNLLHATQMVL